MFPSVEPRESSQAYHGIVNQVTLTDDAELRIVIFLKNTTRAPMTDTVSLDLTNQYIRRKLFAAVGRYCFNDQSQMMDFRRLVGTEIVVIFHTALSRDEYLFTNFQTLLVVNELVPFVYPK